MTRQDVRLVNQTTNQPTLISYCLDDNDIEMRVGKDLWFDYRYLNFTIIITGYAT